MFGCALTVGVSAAGAAPVPDDRTKLEQEAKSFAEQVYQFHRERRYPEELAAARHLVAVRDRIEGRNHSKSSDDRLAGYADYLEWFRAMISLGKLLFARGLVQEGESLFARLTSALKADHDSDLFWKRGQINPYDEDHLFTAYLLSGDMAGATTELQAINQRVPAAKRNSDAAYALSLDAYVDALVVRGDGLLRAGRVASAIPLFEEAVARSAALHGFKGLESTVVHDRYVTALEDRGKALELLGDRVGASALFHRAAVLEAAALPSDDVRNVVARQLVKFGDALRDHDPTLTLGNASLVFPSFTELMPGADSSQVASLSEFPTDESLRSDRQLSANRRKYDLYAKWLGQNHPTTIEYLGFVAHDLAEDGDPRAAVELDAKFVDRAALLLGPNNVEVLEGRNVFGLHLRDAGRLAEAAAQLANIVDVYRSRIAAGDLNAMMTVYALRNVSDTLGRYADAFRYDTMLAEPARKRDIRVPDDGTDTEAKLGEPFFALDRIALDLSYDLRHLGRYAEAEAWDREALARRVKRFGPNGPNTHIARMYLATDILAQPRRDGEAYALASVSYRAEARLSQKIWADYEVAEFEGFTTARDIASAARPAYLDSAYRLREASAPVAADPAFFEGIFAAAQDSFYSAAALAVAHTAARRYATGAGAGELVQKRERLSGRMAAALAAIARAEGPRGTAADEDRADRSIDANEKASIALRAELKRRAPRYETIVAQPALTTAAARQLMRPEEAALIIVPTERGTHLIAVTRDAISWKHSSLTATQLSFKIARLRRDLDPSRRLDDCFDRNTAYELYSALIAPVAHDFTAKSTLYIVASGALASLPLGVLVTEPPTPGSSDADPDALRATHWLADAYALVEAPSLQALAYQREFNARPAATTAAAGAVEFAGFGDPELSAASAARGSRGGPLSAVDAATMIGHQTNGPVTTNTYYQTPLMDPQHLRELPRLPGTRAELETIRRALRAPKPTVRLDRAMREATIRTADLSHVRILAIATHGLTAGESGVRAEPGLVFTPPATATPGDDGYLAASEAADLNLASAEFVILSACNSGASSGEKNPSSLSGLARAFLFAGTRSLLVSHWPVYDSVAARLTVDVIRRAALPGTQRAVALQRAMRAVREDRVHPEFAHPSAWAPFGLIGEGQ